MESVPELRAGAGAAGQRAAANRPEHARQARPLADTERTQTRNAHGALALWHPCVLPAKIRLGEAEARRGNSSCEIWDLESESDACASKHRLGGGKLPGIAQERRILGQNAKSPPPAHVQPSTPTPLRLTDHLLCARKNTLYCKVISL